MAALTGRFLHITDFHPDPHYIPGATFESGCHRKPKHKKKKKGDKGKGRALGERGEADDAFADLDGEEGEEGNEEAEGFKGKDALSGKWGSAVTYVTQPSYMPTGLKGVGNRTGRQREGRRGKGDGYGGKEGRRSLPVKVADLDSDCDSPMSLVNLTFDWIKKNLADEVDFVVWTGDNAR